MYLLDLHASLEQLDLALSHRNVCAALLSQVARPRRLIRTALGQCLCGHEFAQSLRFRLGQLLHRSGPRAELTLQGGELE